MVFPDSFPHPRPHPFPPGVFDPLHGLAADVPFVLLPVRVELRWFDVEDPTRMELRIRVFPDEIHIAPQLAVTQLERDRAAAYHTALAADGPDATTSRHAYTQLVDRAGASRAAWLVRVLAPGMPPVPSADDDERRMTVSAMPHHWLAIAKAPGLRVVAGGSPISPDLAAAPHDGDDASDPKAYLGAPLAWVTDFETAKTAGMALTMTLLKADAARLDELIVLGVPAFDAESAGAKFGDLIGRHAGGGDAALMPWGTPTNVVARSAESSRVAIGSAPRGDAERTQQALGLAPEAARDIVHDGVDRGAIAKAMQVALWPATWGYFLAEHAAQAPATVAATRAFYLNHVRAPGPYPTLRLGAQPYGVLPVTSLSLWPATAPRTELAGLITRISANCETAVANVPRLVDSADLDRDLVAFLRRLPGSAGAWVREVHDGATASVMLGSLSKVLSVLHHLHGVQSAALGIPANLPIFDRVFDDVVKRLGIPFVAPGNTPRDKPLGVDYLSAIADASPSQLADNSLAPTPLTLLYLLARFAATRARIAVPPLDASPHHPPVLAHALPATVWRRIADLGSIVLVNPDVVEHSAALQALGAVAVGELETAFTGVLDSAAFRVDAWRTAIAKERLEELRPAQTQASYVSGWAWLEKPRPKLRPAASGYVHAPSLAQARTAAVLRAGYDGHRLDDTGSTLAIDLSSERVRAARWLLDGMRDGRPVGRLLGDHLESWLLAHAPNTDFMKLRKDSVPAGEPVPDLADGWALYHQWSTQRPPGALGQAFDDLLALVDAVSDLLLAETVHGAVTGGNTARSAAALDALQRGEVATPNPRVDRTATDGNATQRRVVLVLGAAPGWPGPARPRAIAAPRLEGLAARILGAPSAATIVVTDTDGNSIARTTRTLADLGLCALDVVALAASGYDRELLDRATTSVPAREGATRITAGDPALDGIVLRAAALARLFRTARTPSTDDLAPIAILDPIDRTTALGAEAAAVLVLGFAQPAPIGSIAELPAVASQPGELASWLSDMARVRSALEPLDLLALIAPDVLPLDRRTAAACDVVIAGVANGPAELLLIDAWSEAVPAESLTTGVAFSYDAPRAQPPQVILVAVTPPGLGWTLSLLETIVDETVAAARLRVIAPDDIYSQLAPVLLVTDDPKDLEPSLDLQVVSATVHLEAMS